MMLDRVKRLLARAFEGASGSPRWSPSPQMMFAPGRQAVADAARLAARANYRVANGATAEAVAAVWAVNLVGDGPSAQSQHPNRAMRRALESAWGRFYRRADVDGGDLGGFLARAVRSMVASGEALALMQMTERGELRLKLLSPEQLDRGKNEDNAEGGRTDAGVERNAFGEVIAYWIFPEHPAALSSLTRPSQRIAAPDVLHVFDPKFPGQTRGISWLTPILTLVNQLDRLVDALAERMNTGALFGGFITDIEGRGGGFTDGSKVDPASLSLEPGALRILPPGTDVRFPDLPGTDGAPDLLRHVLRQIGSGTGIPYELLSGDLSQVNYSSAKAGFSQFHRRCRAIRAALLQARCLNLAWARVVTLEVLTGRLSTSNFERDAEDFFAVDWRWPDWESLDPLKEASADEITLRNGIRSRREIIAARGRDIEDVDGEIESDTFVPKITAGGAPANVE